MYLRKLKITHYRKFNEENNEVEFVGAQTISSDTKQFDISSNTTLIIGKNNAGKSTIINALEAIIENYTLCGSDFNYTYLSKYFKDFQNSNNNIEGPYIEFILTIQLEPNSDDRITNLIPFMLIEDVEKEVIELHAKYEVIDLEIFKKNVLQAISKDQSTKFDTYKKIIENTKFKLNFYDRNNNLVDKNFKLSSLMEMESIKANKIKNDYCLSKSFNQIITYRYNQFFNDEKDEVENQIENINHTLTQTINNKQKDILVEVMKKIISMNNLSINLKADITFEKLMGDLIKYEYLDNNSAIPENQFGLGYTNLVMILASIINYIEKYPDTSFNSKINLISIEEPETFMHPQMQELFIKNIEGAIKILLEGKGKKVNFQLLITTHSSHILNSKINSDNGFNNICYLKEMVLSTSVINLYNDLIVPNYKKEGRKEFIFLKKHIKYKLSELFFCDAAIFVEGDSEATLLPYYIEENEILSKYYLSVFNVGGAHAYLYENLITALKVPVLIITDLDIDRNNDNDTSNIKDISNLKTTNNNLIKFFNNNFITEILNSNPIRSNLYIAHQDIIKGIYPTSFEESLILTNYDNKILNDTLQTIKPRIYSSIVREAGNTNFKNNVSNSYYWQKKLSNDKSVFSSTLLFKILVSNDSTIIPKLPNYIENGLNWLTDKLQGNNDAK